MSANTRANRRGICTLTGMAVGFRVFYAAVVDSGQLLGSMWISVLAGMLLALPAALFLAAVRRCCPQAEAGEAVRSLLGGMGLKALAAIYLPVLIYDAGASLRIMSSAAKYVAMPESNRTVILLVTAIFASACVALGGRAAAGGAVLWRRLAAILLVILVVTQLPYFRIGWLTPVLGPGLPILVGDALPLAGIFGFIVPAWLMMEPEHDRAGWAILHTLLKSGLITTAMTVIFCMLVPSMPDGQQMRTFRLGWLLTNGRAGLSLEMPYVVLLYSGFLTMLVFELAAGARMLEALFPKLSQLWRSALAGAAAFLIAACGGAEQMMVKRLSGWYYPAMLAPAVLLGTAGLIRMRRKGGKA